MGTKLGSYNGNTCLETFLAKFENCSEYFRWNERDRMFHLRASLEGSAGQVLWDADKNLSVSGTIKILRAWFENEHQAERFGAELCARKRQKDETL